MKSTILIKILAALTALSALSATASAADKAGEKPGADREQHCIERTTERERNRGTEHKEARERAKEVCREARQARDAK